MVVLRNGRTADEFQKPDIYIEELDPVADDSGKNKDPKVMAIVGRFQKGPLDQLMDVTKLTFSKNAGAISPDYPGSMAAYAAFKSGVKRLILVNVRGAGAAKASIILPNTNTEQAEDALKITYKVPGAYGNLCTATVEDGRNAGTFKVILEGPSSEREIYDNLENLEQASEAINTNLSSEFEAEVLFSGEDNNKLKNVPRAHLENGNDGSAPTALHYKGTSDSSGRKTGNELLKTSIMATDIVYDTYVSDVANAGLVKTAEDMNGFAYLSADKGINVTSAISLRSTFDSEFAHLAVGYAKSKSSGFVVPVAVYDCIAHVLSLTSDGTSGFWFEDVESVDLLLTDDDIEELTKNNVVCMWQQINENRDLVYGLMNDYTLSKNPLLRQTYRRRVTSLIEQELYVALTPYRSKHMSPAFEEDIEIKMRDFFNIKKEDEIIEDYQLKFADYGTSSNLDEFIRDIKVNLYNIADKIIIRLLSATNAITNEE